jgi:DNA-binding protein HU-beta
VNKVDLVAALADRTGLSKRDADRVVDAFCDVVQEALAQGEKVSLVGFGTFEVRERQPRMGRNPQTGEQLRIPAARVPAFRAGKSLKETVER